MGWLSKTWKKIKKGFKTAFKSIGKRIKKIFKGFGKFMNKIGIVGQIAMSFILPGIGQALGKFVGSGFSKLTGALAKGGKIAQGAGKVLEAAGNFAKAGHSAFRTVTDGVSSFVKEFGGAALDMIPGMDKIMPSIKDKTFTSAWNTVQENVMNNASKVMAHFNNAIGNTVVPTTVAQQQVVEQAAVETGAGTTPTSKAPKIETPQTAEVRKLTVDAPDVKPPTVPEDWKPQTTGKDFREALTNPDVQKQLSETMGGGADTYKVSPPTMDDIGEIKMDTSYQTEPSLLEKTGDYVGESWDRFKKEVKTYPDRIPKRLGEKAVEKLEEETLIKLGVVDRRKDSEEQQYYGNSMAGYQDVTVGQYQSQAINDRAYNIAIDQNYLQQNPFGYAAQQNYRQQMLRFAPPQTQMIG